METARGHFRFLRTPQAKRGRAVFAGDYGPLKFSHEARDGIDYYQSAVETRLPAERLRNHKDARVIYFQFDNFLHVKVNGTDVRVEVETVAATSSGKYRPDYHRRVFAPPAPPPPTTISDRIAQALGGTTRRIVLAGLFAFALFLGAFGAWWVMRRRQRSV